MRNRSKWVLAWVGGALVGAWLLRRSQRRRTGLVGKVVAITGGSRGLGLCLAREAARRGATLSLCARDAGELELTRRELEAGGAEVLTQVCDVRVRSEVEGFIRATQQRFGRVDMLINNAGVIEVGPQSTMELEDYAEALETHFWGPCYAIHAVLPEMRARRAGHIVNIASFGGKVAAPHLLPYAASKFALVGFSEGLHAELHRDGIAVTTVCPGLLRTGSPAQAFFKGQNEKEHAWFTLLSSMPYLSMSSETAARRILNAALDRTPELILTGRAVMAAKLQGLAPNLVAHLMVLANRLLPEAGGIGHHRLPGWASETDLTRSPLTVLTQRAEVRNREG